jgi:uncharacterized protein
MLPWRATCESALRAFSEADALRQWGVGREVAGVPRPPFDYRFEHTLAVVKLARWLSPRVGADEAVVECAAWLHDCRKRFGKEQVDHAGEASAAVADILTGTDFPSDKIPAVRHAIAHHVGLRLAHPLEPLETACLWDCDKLSKLGAASIVHFTCISGAFQPVTTEGLRLRGERWLALAQGIVESMNTAPARAEARSRLAFLSQYYRQLGREWDGPMESAP